MTVTVRFACRMLLTASVLAPAVAPFLSSDADAATLEEIKARGYMIVATEDDYKPFEFMEDGKPVGFDNELLAEFRKVVPFEIRQEVIPWTGLLAGVSTGKYDVAVTAAMITKERVKSLDFSMPIADSTHYYAKRKGDDSIKEIRDLSERFRAVAEETAEYQTDGAGNGMIVQIPRDELTRMVKDLESQMKTAARDLEVEKAALLRDEMVELRRIIEVDPVVKA